MPEQLHGFECLKTITKRFRKILSILLTLALLLACICTAFAEEELTRKSTEETDETIEAGTGNDSDATPGEAEATNAEFPETNPEG